MKIKVRIPPSQTSLLSSIPTQSRQSRLQEDDIHARFYRGLAELREEFHSTGRFDDSNVKLDEIVKLLVVRFHLESNGRADELTVSRLHQLANSRFGNSASIGLALRSLAQEILEHSHYHNPDGTSIFGSNATLNLQPTDDRFAERIITLLATLPHGGHTPSDPQGPAFDVLNEAFGHFVRSTFRDSKEDAQYMTPAEVVEAMSSLVFYDIVRDAASFSRLRNPSKQNPFVILDPTCGVGSFLVSALHQIIHIARESRQSPDEIAALVDAHVRYGIIGQDKVDRMVRLSKLNLMFFGRTAPHIYQGNSITNGSYLDALEGQVDLILTNPPFGARCDVGDLLRHSPPNRYDMLQEVFGGRANSRNGINVPSEIALLDRYLSLLRPGGRLLTILPDSVVSAKGLYAEVRAWVLDHASLRAIIELPAVTFAQAGTRTKTVILYLQKRELPYGRQMTQQPIFMAACDDIGYRVVVRVGAPVKQMGSINQLPIIVDSYKSTAQRVVDGLSVSEVASRDPSAVWIPTASILNGRWTPNFYRAQRIEVTRSTKEPRNTELQLVRLDSIAEFCSKSRRRLKAPSDSKCISVLHVGADGLIDFGTVFDYRPKSQGLICKEGDVLFSKINPRIPRICVVPRTTYALTCSTEFEILKPRNGMDPYLLWALLLVPSVQSQIQCLTSGTSSSHNRIKDTELAGVLVRVSRPGTSAARQCVRVATRLRRANEAKYEAATVQAQEMMKLSQLCQ